jgi:hypothetical protein
VQLKSDKAIYVATDRDEVQEDERIELSLTVLQKNLF